MKSSIINMVMPTNDDKTYMVVISSLIKSMKFSLPRLFFGHENFEIQETCLCT